jgi:hypothetical protein
VIISYNTANVRLHLVLFCCDGSHLVCAIRN